MIRDVMNWKDLVTEIPDFKSYFNSDYNSNIDLYETLTNYQIKL